MELELSKAELKANELINEANEIEISSNKIELEKELDIESNRNVNTFSNIVCSVVDKGVNYAIKALPIGDGLKDVALDVKEALKTNDFKHIVKTAISSSIREGLEFVGMPFNVLKNINTMKDVALKGGLTKALSAGIDIVCNKYLKNNLFVDLAKDFVSNVKNFVTSKDFLNKLDGAFNKLSEKVKGFKDTCNMWREAYEKFDLEKINELSKDLSKKVRGVLENTECGNENKTIQNITTLINNTKKKLSKIQLEACEQI